PEEQIVTWNGVETQKNVTFLFSTPNNLAANLVGRVLVFNGPLIVGEIPVNMFFDAQNTSTSLESKAEFKELQPIFASYSHRDTPVMEFFRNTRAKLGQKMLVDIYDLRAGEHWADRLLGMI